MKKKHEHFHRNMSVLFATLNKLFHMYLVRNIRVFVSSFSWVIAAAFSPRTKRISLLLVSFNCSCSFKYERELLKIKKDYETIDLTFVLCSDIYQCFFIDVYRRVCVGTNVWDWKKRTQLRPFETGGIF